MPGSIGNVRARTVAVIAGALVLAGFAGAQALVQVAQQHNPRLALSIDGGNAIALAVDADRRWIAEPDKPAARALAGTHARRSLEAMAINPRALRLLGYEAEVQGRSDRAVALLELAERMSRRDLQTQLWLIEANARAGKVDQTLVHYDTALRTNSDAGTILLPILGAAIGDEEIRRALAPYLRREAPWFVPLVRTSIETGTELGPLARMLAKHGQVPARSLQSQLLNALVTEGLYDDAALYFRAIPGARAEVMRGVAFDPAHTDPALAPVAWQPLAGEAANVALERGGAGGYRYHISSAPEERATVLRKVLFLPAGRYRLDIAQSFTVRGAGATAAWRLACLAAPAAPRPILDRAGADARIVADLAVPSGCRAQELTLTIASGLNDTGLEFYVDRVTLTSAGGAQAQARAPQ